MSASSSTFHHSMFERIEKDVLKYPNLTYTRDENRSQEETVKLAEEVFGI